MKLFDRVSVLFSKDTRFFSEDEYKLIISSVQRLNALPTPEEFVRVRSLAENAYDCVVGIIPDSKISAQKFGGEIITTGLAKG